MADQAGRNLALDGVRATALLLMSLAHMWRWMLGGSSADAFVWFVAELGQFPFFMAFGMTQGRVLQREREELLRFIALFGVLALFHSYFIQFTLAWEVFVFIWCASVVLLAGQRLGLDNRHWLGLAALILTTNALLPLGASVYAALGTPEATHVAVAHARRLWRLPGPFFLLPWIVVVLVGSAFGMQPLRRSRRVASAALVAFTIALAVGVWAGARPGIPWATNLVLDKWGATSSYLVLGCGVTVMLYAAFTALFERVAVRRHAYRLVRYLSEHLLEGVILHYPVVVALTGGTLGWWKTAWGVRTVGWGGVMLLSMANVLLLLASLLVLQRVRRPISARIGKRFARLRWRGVATLCVGVWFALLLAGRVVSPGLMLKWFAFVMMLAVAVYYRDGGARPRVDGAGLDATVSVTPVDASCGGPHTVIQR